MPLPPSSPVALDKAVLLVLLPLAPRATLSDAGLAATLFALQQQLGAAVRVLKIDEASHPAVVRSFGTPELPACVLVRQGVELWRQQGLPEGEAVAALLQVAQAG